MEENIYEFYQVDKEDPTVFSFYSQGIRVIKKIVSFQHVLEYLGISVDNLLLADENEDGSIDSMVDSNNGDVLKVLNTVAAILEYYISLTQNRAIYIKGSDERRINIYQWRITKALKKMAGNLLILGQRQKNGPFEELEEHKKYVGFLIIPRY